jgi:hypothetical protein
MPRLVLFYLHICDPFKLFVKGAHAWDIRLQGFLDVHVCIDFKTEYLKNEKAFSTKFVAIFIYMYC